MHAGHTRVAGLGLAQCVLRQKRGKKHARQGYYVGGQPLSCIEPGERGHLLIAGLFTGHTRVGSGDLQKIMGRSKTHGSAKNSWAGSRQEVTNQYITGRVELIRPDTNPTRPHPRVFI